MGHTRTYEALVLRVYDVGEADRFCVLLTKERGKLAARARAVRKMTSRMGGSMLPHKHVQVELHEGKSGFLITNVQQLPAPENTSSIQRFSALEQGTELLVKLLHDEEESPEIFELAQEFFTHCTNETLVLPFTIRLLFLLGMLPSPKEGVLAQHIREDEAAYLAWCTECDWYQPTKVPTSTARLSQLCMRVMSDQLSSDLRAVHTAASFA